MDIDKVRDFFKYTFIFIFGSAYYYTVLFLSRDRPTIYLDDFNVSSLNKTSNSLSNTTTIYFDLRIKNENSGVGVYYDNPLNLTISYFPPTIATNTNITIAKYAIQGFYQGNGKVKHVQTSVVVQDLFSEDEQRRKLGETYTSLMGPVKVLVFKVDLDANIKFKSIENKKSHLVVGAVLEVNGETGSSLLKKTIQLNYASGSNKWGAVQWLLFLPLYLSFVIVYSIAWLLILCVLALLHGLLC